VLSWRSYWVPMEKLPTVSQGTSTIPRNASLLVLLRLRRGRAPHGAGVDSGIGTNRYVRSGRLDSNCH
jgi:hypothetical protein